jgi:hypothetical protein
MLTEVVLLWCPINLSLLVNFQLLLLIQLIKAVSCEGLFPFISFLLSSVN